MELYMMNRQHGRMILESVENGPLIWPSIEENGVTRPKKYSELYAMEAIQADCDVKENNIILQGPHLRKGNVSFIMNSISLVIRRGNIKDLHTTNVDRLHAYLGQHEIHANEHMTGNRALLTNFVEKFLETVRFGNNDFAVIAGYRDVVIGSMTIKKVY
nr:integrase, catalytic region, zinc finger, CCHC-type, peptidase aspartic, catalytic [Tanacetum cinerariifolium]